ncbi:GntR family transcriptional regulator [Roseomonas sp. CAU 1739]|uniref:GntR family transcriptional regulator n=1 Tax=Roseomonas sp. CAU 1739 TaxID=3140364 RepID=UPI00325A4955
MSSYAALSDPPAISVRQIAEEQIRAAIVAGDLLPGQRLPERMLGELTGVGRTTVREAVRQLESEGLVTVVPHRGPTVAVLTEQETRDLYELRAMLEGQAGRLCAQRGTPVQAEALLRSVDTLEQAWLRRQISGVMDANAAFYAALLGGAGNDALRQALGTIHNRLALFRFSSTRWPGRTAQSVVELRAIAEAVAARDAAAGERACIHHIEAAAELALIVLAERARGAAQDRRQRIAIHQGD